VCRYGSTFLLGFALCKAGIKATVKCKLLVPNCSLWSNCFTSIPILGVMLQWPVFALVGTLISSKAVWAFLLVFTLNPMTYYAFGAERPRLSPFLLINECHLPRQAWDRCAENSREKKRLRRRDPAPSRHPCKVAQGDHAREARQQTDEAAGALFLYLQDVGHDRRVSADVLLETLAR
jgi:hypothetical protein